MINLIDHKEFLKEIFREVIQEVISEERLRFYDSIFPMASIKEIEEIEELYGSPDNYKTEDFEDMTDWIIDAN